MNTRDLVGRVRLLEASREVVDNLIQYLRLFKLRPDERASTKVRLEDCMIPAVSQDSIVNVEQHLLEWSTTLDEELSQLMEDDGGGRKKGKGVQGSGPKGRGRAGQADRVQAQGEKESLVAAIRRKARSQQCVGEGEVHP